MNILILTAKFGMGHYNVAVSVKQELENENTHVEIVDFFDTFFPKARKTIYSIFNFLVSKWNRVYNFFYKFSTKKSFTPLNGITIKKIDKLISKKNIDVLISTFPTCSSYISKYKKSNNSKVKLYTYITDVNANKEWIADGTDAYFVASQDTKKQVLEYGVPEDKIIITGIPIKENFKDNKYSEEKNKNEIVIMGGGLGLIPNIDATLEELALCKKVHITLLTGNNQKLFDKYKGKYENVEVVGYTEDVYKYMGKAELIISKVGGITLFEAISSGTPIYTVHPFLSQEIGNATFIERNNIGRVIWEKRDSYAQDVLELLDEEMQLHEMRKNMVHIKSELEDRTVLDVYNEEMADIC